MGQPQSRGKSNPRVVGSGELEQYSSGTQQELSVGGGGGLTSSDSCTTVHFRPVFFSTCQTAL